MSMFVALPPGVEERFWIEVKEIVARDALLTYRGGRLTEYSGATQGYELDIRCWRADTEPGTPARPVRASMYVKNADDALDKLTAYVERGWWPDAPSIGKRAANRPESPNIIEGEAIEA